MLGLLLTGFIVVNGPAPSPDLNAPQRELAQVFEQARRDFEARHAELGLVGAAPLAGREPARAATPELVPQRRVEWRDAETSKPHTAHAGAARRPSR
jgi:hypothetical protein